MQEDRSLGCSGLTRFVLIVALSTKLYDLHSSQFFGVVCRWLTMAELMSASFGEKCLTLEHWQMIKELERLRKERLQ